MSALSKPGADAGAVLLKALLNSREQLGLTQQELAEKAGNTRSSVAVRHQSLERQRRPASGEQDR